MSSIAENIKKLRESRGWSKAELARMIGKSRAAVSLWPVFMRVHGVCTSGRF